MSLAADSEQLEMKDIGLIPYHPEKHASHSHVQNETLPEPTKASPPDVFKVYLFDADKFDDLASRYMLMHRNGEFSQYQLLQGPFHNSIIQLQEHIVMNEYLRRIYQGYSTVVMEESQKKQKAGTESLVDVGKNILVKYQSFELSQFLEARLGYDVIGNSTHLALSSPILDTEFVYFLIDRRSSASIPEHVVTIDEAMDAFTRFDRTTVNASHTFSKLGLRTRIRYGTTTGVLDYGFSKSLFGPLALQVVREENYQKDLPNNLIFQVTVGRRF